MFKRIWLIIFIISLGLSLFYTYALLHPLPLTNQTSSITMYDCNGNIMYESTKVKQDNYLTYEQIPADIIMVFMQVEDKRFLNHLGFDPLRFTKALYSNISNGQIIAGGSTITQQYAKNLFLSNEQSIERKIKEFIYASRLEMQYSKQQILEGYLNTIYFGHGIYGINQASHYFFNQALDTLNLKQIAMLAAIPNGPSYYSIKLHPENNEARANLILQTLYQRKIITKAQLNKYTKLKPKISTNIINNDQAYYCDYILSQLNQLNINKNQPLSIYTYYDPLVQHSLIDSINKQLDDDSLQVSALITKSFTNEVIALVGGKDYANSQYNRCLYAKRQIASTIKPLLYYCALENGFNIDHEFLSQPTTFNIDNTLYAPSNFDNIYANRKINMIEAIAYSDNIYALKTHLALGSDVLVNALAKFNLASDNVASLALGSVNLSLFELNKIYHCFASNGQQYNLSGIKYISNDQQVLYEANRDYVQLLSLDNCLIISQLLQAPFNPKLQNECIPTMLGYQGNAKMSAKSGTSDWDSYVMSYNPDYTIGIWCGYDDNRLLTHDKLSYSKKIYQHLVNTLYPLKSDTWYEQSSGLKEYKFKVEKMKNHDDFCIFWQKN